MVGKLSLIAMFLVATVFATTAISSDPDFAKMETDMWNLAKNKKLDELKAMFAPGRQSINGHGTLDLKGALDAVSKMEL